MQAEKTLEAYRSGGGNAPAMRHHKHGTIGNIL
jgi:hypothetical protein